MATTGELRAIVQELHLVDVGNAESYLGGEIGVEEESPVSPGVVIPFGMVHDSNHLATCNDAKPNVV
jgi:hypothetical protein